MPNINRDILDCIFFLYDSVKAAEFGATSGGTGFFVGVPMESPLSGRHLYAVTVRHNITAGFAVVRVIDRNGEIHIARTKADDWRYLTGHDVAVCPLQIPANVKVRAVTRSNFLFQQDQKLLFIGDACYLVGRFIGTDDRESDIPLVRFGNLCATSRVFLPHNPLLENLPPDSRLEESFLVEIRSALGFSGSPVFVRIDPTGLSDSYTGYFCAARNLNNAGKFRPTYFELWGDPSDHDFGKTFRRAAKRAVLGDETSRAVNNDETCHKAEIDESEADAGDDPAADAEDLNYEPRDIDRSLMLLGVQWGVIGQDERLWDDKHTEPVGRLHVRLNSGISGVVPAWHVQSILDSPVLKNERQERESQMVQESA